MTRKILVVSSENQLTGSIDSQNLEEQIKLVQEAGIKVEWLVDPTRLDLEKALRSNPPDFVYCSTFLTYNSKAKRYRQYNVLKVIEQIGIPHLCSSWYHQLLCMDKIVTSKASGFGLPSRFVSRTIYTEEKELILEELDEKFPLIIKPNNLAGSIGITAKSVVKTYEDLEEKLSNIFSENLFIDEVIIEYFLEDGEEYTVSILGDVAMHLTSVTKIDKGHHLVYGEMDKNKPMAEREIKYSLCHDPYMRQIIHSTSLNLFSMLGLKDMARFDYIYKDRLYLIEINGLPVLANSFCYEWQKKGGFKKAELLLLLVAYFMAKRDPARYEKEIKQAQKALPEPFTRFLNEVLRRPA